MTIASTPSETQEVSQVAPKDNSAEMNLRKLARTLEEERAGRIRLEQEIAQLRESSKKPSRDEDEDYRSDEPYIDEKRLERKLNKFAETFEKKVDQKAEEKAAMMIERERQQGFLRSNPDFAQIMNDETLLQKFVERFPDIADPLLEMPDNFARKKLVYQNIKALGINRPEAPKVSIQDKIDANRRSPYYQPSGGSTPPYAAQGDFSAGGQKNAYSKMQELIKGRRG